MRKPIALAATALALAGCDELWSLVRDYEVVTRTQCLTTTADNVYIYRENYWLNTGRIVEVHFSRYRKQVLYVPGEDLILYREIRKGSK